MDNMIPALYLMLYGLTGVFSALIIFWGMIKLLVIAFPHKPEQEQ